MDQDGLEFPAGAAWVIGGSGGVGAAICEALAKRGCPVALTFHRNQSAAEALCQRLQGLGVQTHAGQLDLADDTAIAQEFSGVRERFGRVHSVILAAGSNIPMEYIADVTPQRFREVMQADALGAFSLVHATLPHLREAGGSYVALTSVGLSRFPPRDMLSVVPKASVEALLRGVAREEGRNGVRANSVQLGVIEAGIFLRLKGEAFDQTWLDSARRNTALKRFGKPEEVAEAVVFLASNRASYVTGQSLLLDGGHAL